jgi:hypothetical protein
MAAMPTDSHHFSLDKVKALKAYFFRMRNSAKGTPEYNDLDTTVTLCEQLVAVMAENDALRKAGSERPSPPSGKPSKTDA